MLLPAVHVRVSSAADVKVALELRQVADVYLGGTLMAYFDSNGRDFFYPWANPVPRLETGRELIMERTIDFPVSHLQHFKENCWRKGVGKQ